MTSGKQGSACLSVRDYQDAGSVNVDSRALPVRGDPVIDNGAVPIQIRLLRKRIFDRLRSGELAVGGRSAQKKLEKICRLEYWQTDDGEALEAEQT